jgi:transmembrane sensor
MHVQRQIDRLLAHRAAEWIETLKSGDPRDQAAFVEWLRQSKLHVEHYLEMVAIDRELQRLDAAQCGDVTTLLERVAPNVIELEQARARGAQAAGIARYRRSSVWIGAALAVGMLSCFALFQWYSGSGNRFTTTVGEQRTVTLADGSVVTLNALSSLKIDFSPTARNVELEDGEAVFKVAQDPARPFVVHTRTADVRALGTQFNVYQRPEDTLVTVLEGRVQVTTQSQAGLGRAPVNPTVQRLSAGEEAQVETSGRIEMRPHPDVHKALAWRERRLLFEETPLEEMVREFNRYGRSVQIRIEGIEPGTRRYGGIFDADDPQSLADLLAREPDLIVESRGKEIVVRKR